ncbi:MULTISPECIES: amidase [unclassified Bradyrhizobium]|uniref:amidase n=1 Tax=unclassified Bradyrhizobium TaxID=2631580 RepID=UPI0016065DEE|nr:MULTISPECIES: amidase [unclassified Bradyrhizobium]MBB4262852.1 aspartyl-tRNA(Asn)/glutamyl-tRNA(Gln) amidotransferase subunit A [Bradyrhizobium sp. CIR3A]MBB4360719.1 aspartyl-tRNA(Asn)/glutamyl-tRNA(Gln) amidotransferase subunit A [Bradyrhizobium sp. CIR18]MBB4393665.1 aspartyl-tRNA(Asn)/glutamyl-tRNA(Gln) amidotransferase subunit A [Bradyrhizobium sp. ERR14]MBB4429631.1 aspartyl-tRNA(Asn)/glutamyl-tRNA(Gln) amidotransferase subunit A [Bradyrhizobium sp. CIR48]
MTDGSGRTAFPPAPTGLGALSATEIMAGYRRKAFTPRDVIDDTIAALEAADETCNAVVTPMYEQARAEADRLTREMRAGEAKGPLAGVPVTIKDLVFVAGVPAYAGSPMNEGFVPEADAAVVSALKASGAIITCKTTTCESGYKLTADSPVTGITRNPWNPGRTSGGSSGGAAASVAAGCGPIAIGTDGVGSIRVPSSFCGVFGLKPTFGLVPRSPGFSPPSWASLAHTGPITRTVADAALTLEIIAGYDVRDAASLPASARRFNTDAGCLDGIRIGASADLGYAAVSPDVCAAFGKALAILDSCGAQVTMDGPGLDPGILEHTLKPIAFTEQAAAVASKSATDLASSEADYRNVVSAGRRYSGTDYIEASYRRGQTRSAFVKLFERVDVLVTPTVAVTAFEAGRIGVDTIDGRKVDPHLGWSPFTWPVNLAGLPAATLPCGFDRDGMPIGLQIVAPWLDEPTIFRIAAAFEQAQPWAKFWPQLALRQAGGERAKG